MRKFSTVTRAPYRLRLPYLLIAAACLACGDDAADRVETAADGDAAEADTPSMIDTAEAPEAVEAEEAEETVDTSADTTQADTTAPDTAHTAEDSADTVADVDTAEAQVIDPDGDTDRDGIMDLDEVADGTDPFDPRSARAWHPELAGHPRLFVRPEDQPRVAALATSNGARTKALWTRLTALAARAVPSHPAGAPYNTAIPPQQGQIVEAAALVGFATGDLAMADKALEVLAAPFPDPSPLNQQSLFNAGDHYDLLEAEALQGFCSGYDLAAGTPGVEAALITAAAERLVERVDYFRKLCMTSGGCTTLLRAEPDNHSIKALAALGTCAIALPDRPTAAADFNEAVAAIDWLAHDKQGNLEGGWAESWNYLDYSGETHLGFLLAAHHTVALIAPETRTWRVRPEGWITRQNPNNRNDIDVLDPAADPLWRAVYERALFATLPWGPTPPVDDANPSTLHGGLLAGLFDDARFLGNWDLVSLSTGRQLIATLLSGDLDREAVAPDWPLDQFLPEAGFSLLRSSLATTASYFHMQHERERMRLLGGSHEHADQLSFLLAAHGTWLAIDPGYIDFSHHDQVKYGKDHNMVLVDGQGPEFFLDGLVDSPPNSDAYLHDHGVDPPFASCIASTKYGGAEFRRRVVRIQLAGQDVFVVADDLVAAGEHTWTFQLNGLASEEIAGTSFALTPTAAGADVTWQRATATLFATIVATEGEPIAASRLEENAFGARHRCFTLDALMGENAGFLTVLVPAPPGVTPLLSSERSAGAASITVTLEGGTVEVVLDASGLTAVFGDATGSWSMVTPSIPDPQPFLP